MEFETIRYAVADRVARITLDRPTHGNAIVDPMPRELRAAVEAADADDHVHVIVLDGAGKIFCGGYDLEVYAEARGAQAWSQDMPWDPTIDYRHMSRNTEDFMSLWRSLTPVVCKVHGAAVAGGSDIALCADLVVMAEDAVIGYPPARVWGCPTTMMWIYRLGPEKAKRMLLTGDLVSGREAADMGLVLEAVPASELDARIEHWTERIASVPRNQLSLQKMVVNQAFENMGLHTTQMVATLFDGIARHTPEGHAFKRRAEDVGWKQAVSERDSGTPLG
ncbi:MAG: crotonase/enoyl-CoA hydratase family protein [Nitriliruptorales bacterium]|nr:crotonase/enoyl-CoA hydratase family protein [Nitriliruptorales bacterium]